MGYSVRAYYSISPKRYYKDDSWWSAGLKSNEKQILENFDMTRIEPSSRSKAIEDIINIGSFVEALVLNHYVLVRKIFDLRTGTLSNLFLARTLSNLFLARTLSNLFLASELSTLFQRVTTSELQNGVNILKSIDEGPFQMGTFRETLAEGNEGALHLGPERPRVYSDLSPKDKERYNTDIRATNILLQGLPKGIYSLINHYNDTKDIWDNVKMLLEGSELTKEDRESQLYDDFEHFHQHK
ncbi:hypothetical protein Tco_0922733 [Tanacetum coccineum]|uniref:Integrase, catalytic region, zinc finger, CCHC-type, peptidase aspartic, catalytic n=1 Tax=Tanacetum coccineum TaxID=301880 RepID=A0ABQ5CZY1_9ASTR